MAKRGLLSALAGDMIETLREDLAGLGKIEGMEPFVQAVSRELPKKRRRRATAEEKAKASTDDVAGAARVAFGGIVRAMSNLAEKTKAAEKKPAPIPRPRRKRKMGPERD